MAVRHFLDNKHAIAVLSETSEYVAVICTYCKINRHFSNETRAIEVADEHYDNVHDPDRYNAPNDKAYKLENVPADLATLSERVKAVEYRVNHLIEFVNQLDERLTETAHSMRNWDSLMTNIRSQMNELKTDNAQNWANNGQALTELDRNVRDLQEVVKDKKWRR